MRIDGLRAREVKQPDEEAAMRFASDSGCGSNRVSGHLLCRAHIIEWLESRVLFADLRFAVVGDYSASQALEDVSNLIKSWNPAFVTTVGDNNYPVGSASTIDQNI